LVGSKIGAAVVDLLNQLMSMIAVAAVAAGFTTATQDTCVQSVRLIEPVSYSKCDRETQAHF